MIITESANAKINLYLDLVGKLENGYHEIVSVMQSISLSDCVKLESLPEQENDRETIFFCSDSLLPQDGSNLAMVAAERFWSRTGIPKIGLRISVEKHIPVAAGLAGGSSDAAAVLRGLNRLTGAGLSLEELCRIGAEIGADVPFCLMGGTALAEGIGEKLTPLVPMPEAVILIAKKGNGVSTKEAYARLDEQFGDFSGRSRQGVLPLLQSLEQRDLAGMCGGMMNLFEAVISQEHREVNQLIHTMREHRALFSGMSGSGPSVFGIFEDREEALSAHQELEQLGAFTAVCNPV